MASPAKCAESRVANQKITLQGYVYACVIPTGSEPLRARELSGSIRLARVGQSESIGKLPAELVRRMEVRRGDEIRDSRADGKDKFGGRNRVGYGFCIDR